MIKQKVPHFFAAALIICPSIAHAYLDPGTGSILVQAVIAVLLAGVFWIKNAWKKIAHFFKHRFANRDSDKRKL